LFGVGGVSFYPQITQIIADYGVVSCSAALRRRRATPPFFSQIVADYRRLWVSPLPASSDQVAGSAGSA
ncbi:MAG: hypothetical protein ACOX9E_12010, partial [Lentisphaeria bacterium]